MKYVPNSVSTRFARTALKAQKHSPTIAFGVGVVGMVATTVVACRSTLRLESVLDEHKETTDGILAMDSPDYSEKDRQHDLNIVRVRAATAVGRLYAPAVVLGALSIAALTHSHNELMRRNAGLSAALFASTEALKAYRARVVDELGADKDREFMHGTEKAERMVEDTNGPKKRKTKVAASGGHSEYAKLFSRDTSSEFKSHPEYNIAFLRSKQNWLNDRLRSRGHVFLNEVFDELGLDRTPAGSQVGWIYAPYDKGAGFDSYIDFCCWENDDMAGFLEFMTGEEDSIWLDFNVDGEIWRSI